MNTKETPISLWSLVNVNKLENLISLLTFPLFSYAISLHQPTSGILTRVVEIVSIQQVFPRARAFVLRSPDGSHRKKLYLISRYRAAGFTILPGHSIQRFTIVQRSVDSPCGFSHTSQTLFFPHLLLRDPSPSPLSLICFTTKSINSSHSLLYLAFTKKKNKKR